MPDQGKAGQVRCGRNGPSLGSRQVHPQAVGGPAYLDSARAFAVFDSIARIDSLAGDPKGWKPEKGAIDTLRMDALFDTGFVFPQNPAAVMPYAYDDSYRDDTLWRSAYGTGLFTQDHPCALNYVLAGQFLHPAKWLKRGLKEEDILAGSGEPPSTASPACCVISRSSRARGPGDNADDTSSTVADTPSSRSTRE